MIQTRGRRIATRRGRRGFALGALGGRLRDLLGLDHERRHVLVSRRRLRGRLWRGRGGRGRLLRDRFLRRGLRCRRGGVLRRGLGRRGRRRGRSGLGRDDGLRFFVGGRGRLRSARCAGASRDRGRGDRRGRIGPWVRRQPDHHRCAAEGQQRGDGEHREHHRSRTTLQATAARGRLVGVLIGGCVRSAVLHGGRLDGETRNRLGLASHTAAAAGTLRARRGGRLRRLERLGAGGHCRRRGPAPSDAGCVGCAGCGRGDGCDRNRERFGARARSRGDPRIDRELEVVAERPGRGAQRLGLLGPRVADLFIEHRRAAHGGAPARHLGLARRGRNRGSAQRLVGTEQALDRILVGARVEHGSRGRRRRGRDPERRRREAECAVLGDRALATLSEVTIGPAFRGLGLTAGGVAGVGQIAASIQSHVVLPRCGGLGSELYTFLISRSSPGHSFLEERILQKYRLANPRRRTGPRDAMSPDFWAAARGRQGVS